MFSSKIRINNKKFEGILDFWVLKKVQSNLKEEDIDYKIHEIFEKISDIENIDMSIVTSLLLFSIVRYMKIDEETIEKEFFEDKLDLDKFNDIFIYINKLIINAMPMDENKEDIFEEEVEQEDWDFPYMEYLWYSVLKRTDDFYSITPKTFFNQMDIYKKMNNVKEENVKYL